MTTVVLPTTTQLVRLAKRGKFPVQRQELEGVARRNGYTTGMIEFLRLFPSDEVFKNRVDFLTRCEELELFMGEERDMPKEVTRSPQDL